MFERFTTDSRDVVRLAQEQARELLHDHIGTEHLLLALARKPDTPAATMLASLGAVEETVRVEVERRFRRGDEPRLEGQIPFTPDAKKALELSLREALALGHNYIDTEHLLLGLVRVDKGGAAKTLATLGVDRERLREELVRRMPPRRQLRPGRRVLRERLARGRRSLAWATAGEAWEYRLERPEGAVTAEWLNELGAERWELVGFTPEDLGGGLVFKRPRALVVDAAGGSAEPGASAG